MPFDPSLRLPRGAVLSHATAAQLWELPVPPDLADTVHVPLPRSRSRWASTKAVVHRRSLRPDEMTEVDGAPVTTPLRTLLDLATSVPMGWAVAAADAALSRGLVTLDELVLVTSSAMGRGSGAVRAMGELVDPRSESPFESVLRVTLTLGGMPPPEAQWVISEDGVFVARVDFAWPHLCIAVEADGFAYHSDRESYRSDRDRLNRLQQLDWRVLRFSWERLMGDPDGVVAEVRRLVVSRTTELAERA